MTPPVAQAIAQQPRLGFDQLMAIEAPRKAGTAAFIQIFNNDGSEAEACGNGTRCAAWVLMRSTDQTRLVVQTTGGDLVCDRLGATRFAVDMGRPLLNWQDIPLAAPAPDTGRVRLSPADGVLARFSSFSAVSMGNPHAVFFVEDVASVSLAEVGPVIEHHPAFPRRTNVSFAEVLDRSTIKVRVWERSAGATLACGSAACATLVAAVRGGLVDRRATLSLPGGDLVVEWRDTDDHVIMAGETELEHQGVLPAHLWSMAT